jgi:ATP-dependent Zn protease
VAGPAESHLFLNCRNLSAFDRLGEKLYYEPEQRDAEAEINCLLETADRRAHELIQTHKENTGKLARALLDRETLTKDEVLRLLTPANVALPAGAVLA